jgi:Cys-tRNA(Pro) deacylase
MRSSIYPWGYHEGEATKEGHTAGMEDEAMEHPDTPALRALATLGIPHEVVRSRRANSIEEAAELRGIPVAALLKTLVVRRSEDDYLFVLVPGDRSIDWAKLRTHLGVRRMTLPDAAEAFAATGYERGTITPFGASRRWPVIADASIKLEAPISLGGGAHGVSVRLSAHEMVAALAAEIADVTKPA